MLKLVLVGNNCVHLVQFALETTAAHFGKMNFLGSTGLQNLSHLAKAELQPKLKKKIATFTTPVGGGRMVLGKLPVPGRPTILITVGQGPIALAVGAGGVGLDFFTLIYPLSSFSLSLGDGPI